MTYSWEMRDVICRLARIENNQEVILNTQDSINAAVDAINSMVTAVNDKLDSLNPKPADDVDTSKLDKAVADLKDACDKLGKDDTTSADTAPAQSAMFPASPTPAVGSPVTGDASQGDVKNPDGSLKNPAADAMNAAGKGDTDKVDQAKDDAAAQAADHANDFKGVDTQGNVL